MPLTMPRSEMKVLLGGASFVFACRLFGAATAFITQMLLARWMGAEALGVYVYAFAWCVLLSTLGTAGLPGGPTFRVIGKGLAEDDPSAIAGFAGWGSKIVFIASTLICVVALFLAGRLGNPVSGDDLVLLIALSIIPLYALVPWVSGIAHALNWFSVAFLPEFVIRPGLLLLVLGVVWLAGTELTAMLVMSIHIAVIAAVVTVQCLMLKRNLRRQFSSVIPRVETVSWLKLALPFLFTSLYINTFIELNLVIAGWYLPTEEIAILSTALKIAFVIAFGIQAVNAMILPDSARLHAAGDTLTLQRVVSRATRLQFCGAILGLLALITGGRWALSLFGPDFVAGYRVLLILAVSQVIVAAFGPGRQLLGASGNERYCLTVYACVALVLVGLHVLLTPRFGMEGAAWAIMLTVVVQSIWINAIALRRLAISPSIFRYKPASSRQQTDRVDGL